MAESEEPVINRGTRRGRRWIAASLLLLISALVLWQLAERFIGAEQLRPVLERELTKVFGIPATIETLDIRWIPQPHLAAGDVTLGKAPFQIHADAVYAEANFGSLWRGVIRLGQISSDAIRIDLPADDTELSRHLSAVVASLFGSEETSENNGDSNIEIGEIQLSNIAVFRGNSHAADGNLVIRDVLAPVVHVAASANTPIFSPTAQLAADITIESRAEGDSAISGTLNTTDFPLAALLDVPLVSSYALTGAAAVSGTFPGRVQLAAEGQAHSSPNPELDGTFTGNLWYRDGQIDINDLRLDGDQIQAVADISLPEAGGFACRIQRGALDNAALATVAEAILPPGFISFSDAGRMTVLGLLFGQEAQAPLRFSEGEASFLQLEVQRGAGGVLRDLSARVRVQENGFAIDDLSNDYVHLTGAITPDFATGATHVALQGTADLSSQLLRLIIDDSRITAASGRIRLDTIEGTIGAEDAPLRVVARLEEAAVQVQQADGQTLSVDTVHGGIRYESGVLTLEDLTGAGFTLSGTLAPEPTGWTFDLHGQGDLSNPLVALVLPAQLKAAAGAVDLKTLRGRWQPGLALPADLALEGALREGRLQIDSPSYAGQLSGITGSFTTDSEAISTDLRFDAEHLGAARIDGRYLFAESRWVGEADLNLPAIAGLFLSGTQADRWVEALLANQRAAKLALSVDLPDTPGAPVTLVLEARSASGIAGSIDIGPAASGFALGKIDLRGAVSAAAIAPLLLDGLHGEGAFACRFSLDPANKRFTATADLKAATLSWGEWIRKPSGIEGTVEIAGATEPAWAVSDCQIRLLGQALRVRPKGAGFVAEPFTLDLAALAPLLPSGTGARGALKGQFATSPSALDLELDAVTLPLPGGAGTIQADGAVQSKAGLWSFDNLHLQGPRTDCVITAAASDGGWRGQLQGPSLDLDAAVLLAALGGGGQGG
ncbi:MAG: hypothetical protein IT368_03385, partial [Candidatus Hydrogenedentes bacterium]|nr:hypothetical protein [Candidatus Hydrogenedentota bacterium]